MSEFVWTGREVARALELPNAPEAGSLRFAGVSTDTRRIGPGSLFVALVGDRFDAHEFLGDAARAGATAAVVSRVPEDAPEGMHWFRVENTLAALGQLARHRSRAFRGRVVGITGTNGKTTTKELLRAALGGRFRVHATEENLNNQIGVPLTLLALPDDAEVAVVEMGTNEPGEIALLAAIAEPEAGIVTSVGAGHLEKLGSVGGVLREKTTLLAALPSGGIGLVAEEPPGLPARARELLGPERVRTAGFGREADLRPDGGAVSVQADGTTLWEWEGVPVHLPLRGRHNVRNALLALGLAREWGVSPRDAVRGLGVLPPPRLRGEWKQIGRVRLIADCYNSNPPSLLAAVDLLADLPAPGSKVAVVGTMRELGTEAEALHREAAAAIAARIGDGIDRVVATGAFADAFGAFADDLGDRLIACEDPLQAYTVLYPTLAGDETLLLKASRGEALERWLPLLERDWTRPTQL